MKRSCRDELMSEVRDAVGLPLDKTRGYFSRHELLEILTYLQKVRQADEEKNTRNQDL